MCNDDDTFVFFMCQFAKYIHDIILRISIYGTNILNSCTYNEDSTLSSQTVGSDTFSYAYDDLKRIIALEKNNTPIESYNYNDYGNIACKSITNGANHTYSYAYKSDSTQSLMSESFNNEFSTNYKTDCLGRRSEKVIKVADNDKLGEYYYYAKYGDRATNRVSTIRYGNVKNGAYVIGDNLKYTYDSMGNISKIFENGKFIVSYEYDSINRLIREDNKQLGKSYFFNYDNEGNITSREKCDFTMLSKEEIATLTSLKYNYLPNSDQLASIDGSVFEYDNIGNATTWNGKTVAYAKGRQVTIFDTTTFGYNGLGQRLSKTKDNATINFTYDSSGKVVKQSNGLEFIYDQSGVSGIIYDSNIYHYRKNIQGDITHILDNSGNIVVKYMYDAFGNYAVVQDTNGLAELNPFRYRSYYYDTETDLYFLQTRYYDPEVGRFITIDDTQYLAPDQINGLNLYAYCGNNPVMRVDPNGNAWWEWLVAGLIVSACIVGAVFTGGTSLVGLALVGAAIGGGMSIASQAISGNVLAGDNLLLI